MGWTVLCNKFPLSAGFSEGTKARKNRVYSLAFKRQVAQEYLEGGMLNGVANRHEVDRTLVRNWARKYEDGMLNSDAPLAGLVRDYEKRIASLERLAGKQALEIEFLKGLRSRQSGRKTGPRRSSPPARPQHRERLRADGPGAFDLL
ncbi:MAG: transposase [Rhizobiaceae bacterium]